MTSSSASESVPSRPASVTTLPLPIGVLSSHLSATHVASSSSSSPLCPYSFHLTDYERLSLTIIDFSAKGRPSAPAGNDVIVGQGAAPSLEDGAPCIVVSEQTGNTNTTSTTERIVCGNGVDRETLAYRSKTNIVDIYFRYNMSSTLSSSTSQYHEFLVKYEGLGIFYNRNFTGRILSTF